jgi:hypothetical protein
MLLMLRDIKMVSNICFFRYVHRSDCSQNRAVALCQPRFSRSEVGSAESMIVSCWQSFSVCPMLLLPAEFLVQQLFNPGKKHRAECKPHREWAPPPPRGGAPRRGGRALPTPTRPTAVLTGIRHPRRRAGLSLMAFVFVVWISVEWVVHEIEADGSRPR